MLQIKNLNIMVKKDLHTLVSDFNLVLNEGDKAAIIGEEGNGKSTLLKLIYDENLAETYVEYSGEISKRGLIIGYLSQELTAEEKELTAYEFCLTEEAFQSNDGGELSINAAKLNMPVELMYSERKMSTLSGGEKVKLRMALLMLKNPDVLLLDEPSNDLDIETLKWMEGFINSVPGAVLYISHDETLLENTANMIIHVELLRKKRVPRYTVVKSGYRQYIDERFSKFQHQEQVANKEKAEFDKKQKRFREIYQKVDHAQATNTRQDPHMGRLLKKKMKAVKSLEHRMEKEGESLTEMPESEDAIMVHFEENISIPEGKTVLEYRLKELKAGDNVLAKDIDIIVKGPRRIGIIGRNGIGKTTLLKLIAQELLKRQDIKTAYMPQDYMERMNMELTPVEFLAKSTHKDDLTQARTFLGSMRYTTEECDHMLKELSGGQKAKLFFLKMILDGSNVLVLDEPTRNFSPLSSPVIRGILADFKGCIISISHDRKYLSEVCDTLYELTDKGLQTRHEI